MTIVSNLEFDAERWNEMPREERVRRCLMFAHEAQQLASEAAPEIKDSYVGLANRWLALATEIEKAHPGTERLS
jgi:hypothetical protein